MPNNIKAITEHMEEKARERAEEAAENFREGTTLTEEEQARLAELQKNHELVVKEIDADGNEVSVPISEFTSEMEARLKKIKDAAGNLVGKGLNAGDIKKTLADVAAENRLKALDAFRKMSVIDGESTSDGGNIDDAVIEEINTEAVNALIKAMNVDRIDSNDIPKFLKPMPLRKIVELLPDRFVHMYMTEKELQADDVRAKSRLIQTLVYLTLTGPELDYLNQYIDHQNMLMMLSQQIVQAEIDMTEVIKSKEKMADIATKASVIRPPDTTSIWARYIQGDPMSVHNHFAQLAVTTDIILESYLKLYEEYKDDYDARTMIQEQIDECAAKKETYLSVTDLKTMAHLLEVLENRLKLNNRNGYKNIVREAIAAVDRISRSKQNVAFPSYDPSLGKKPEIIFNHYMTQYSGMLKNYNKTVIEVLQRNSNEDEPQDNKGICPVEIAGYSEDDVTHYFALLLLVIYGRIMKALSGPDITKYQAIELDCYFKMYCRAGKDVYLMTNMWKLFKPFVQYCLETWPIQTKPTKKGK